MKRIIASSSRTKDAQMIRTYQALCSLCDAVEIMDTFHQVVFENTTGIKIESLLDAKYDLNNEIKTTSNTSLSDVLKALKRFAYSLEELSNEDAEIFEEATGLSINAVLNAHYDLHHGMRQDVEMSTDITFKNTSLMKVCNDFSQFVGSVENLSQEDAEEFKAITGFTAAELLEMYSGLVNYLR